MEAKKLPVIGSYDVVVAGAGPAGICAALAASREGVRTALVERYGMVGGNLTTGYVGPIMGGTSAGTMSDEIRRRLHVVPRVVHDFEQAKIELPIMLAESGVDLFLQTVVADVNKKNDELNALVVATPQGLATIEGHCFVDCTGDGTVAYLAGAPFEYGRADKLVQPGSLMFILGGVEPNAIYCQGVNPQVSVPEGDFIQVCHAAAQDGRLPKNVTAVRIFQCASLTERMINAIQANIADMLSVKQISQAEHDLRLQIRMIHDFLRKVAPGYQHSFIQGSSSTIGIRESRRIVGEYMLQDEDVEQGKTFADVVVHKVNFLIDIHNPTGGGQAEGVARKVKAYDIPYHCFIPRKIENLLVAGRAISGTHRAHASYRVMNICMPMGQAAGLAAALCVKTGMQPRSLKAAMVQQRLVELGVDLFSDIQYAYPFNPSN